MGIIQIKPEELCWLKNQPYPFYFKKVSENGKPVLWGDFSGGMIKSFAAYVESECEWDEVIYPVPPEKINNFGSYNNSTEANSNSLLDSQSILNPMNPVNPLSPFNMYE